MNEDELRDLAGELATMFRWEWIATVMALPTGFYTKPSVEPPALDAAITASWAKAKRGAWA